MKSKRLWVIALAILPLLAVTEGGICAEQSTTRTRTQQVQDGSRDFDFLIGNWKVHNRELRDRLAESHEWVEFDATDAFHRLDGNLGLEENYSTTHWKDFFALGLHLYDSARHRWTLYWADTRNDPGTIQTLAAGTFNHSIGTFYASDTYKGKPIDVRVIWKSQDENHVHWEQAFSADHGHTWETNWTMEFIRP